MSAKDKNLVLLYWKLQRKVHTNPAMRSYLHQLERILKTRQICAVTVNDVGWELAMENRI